MNNRLRIAGVLLAAALAAWLILRGCTPERETDPSAEPPRPAFSASRPLRLDVIATRSLEGKSADVAWLEPELRRLLRAAGFTTAAPDENEPTFLARIAISADGRRASLALIAPDQVLEREQTIELDEPGRATTVAATATALTKFLGGTRVPSDWSALLGTNDAAAYDVFTRAQEEILGAAASGFTRPSSTGAPTRTVERLEALARSQSRFARARALLALGYLSLGGEDEDSLTQLATTTAEKALALDPNLSEAHAALGLASLRRNEWLNAKERFDSALASDANSAPALEGLACLLADAGHFEAARPLALRAVALLPRSVGANECLAYVAEKPSHNGGVVAAAQVEALRLMLQGDAATAERVLKESLGAGQMEIWARPLLRATARKQQTASALRAITRAASDAQIDASTEILSGAALKQAEFVLNRIARLQRENAPAPLRILWLPDAAFLRKHPRFESVVSAAGLPAFWQDHGAPDVCASEPKVYGCALTPPKKKDHRE